MRRSRPDHYILDGRTVRPIWTRDAAGNMILDNLIEWATAYEDADRNRVGWDEWADGTIVSTVFLGVDPSYDGPPQLFETVTRRDIGWHDARRTATWDDARAMHQAQVAFMALLIGARPVSSFDPDHAAPGATVALITEWAGRPTERMEQHGHGGDDLGEDGRDPGVAPDL